MHLNACGCVGYYQSGMGRVEGISGQSTFFKSPPNILGLAKPKLHVPNPCDCNL